MKSLDAAGLLPHRPPMMLISRVVSVGDQRVVCETDASSREGLLARFAEDGKLPQPLFAELMAQAVGCWAGKMHASEQAAEVGFLMSVRSMKFSCGSVPEGVLVIAMDRVMADGKLASFEGTVSMDGQVLASGRLAVYQPDRAEFAKLFDRSPV